MTDSKSMQEWVEEYLTYRRKLGFQLRIEGMQLLQFAKYVDGLEYCGPVTTELALKWATLPKGTSRLYWARRLEVVRCFTRYQSIFDPKTEIPASHILGPAHRRSQPYIYSDTEIAQLMEVAGNLAPSNGIRPRTYRTLIGLLACTGLRISEALKLTRDDVDRKRGLLRIVETKFRKTRIVPLHDSTIEQLSKYTRFRDRYLPMAQSKAFFLAERGTSLKYSTVRTTFRKILQRVTNNTTKDGRLPRLHDLRHTFVCRRLLQWYRDGVDVNHSISALSVYLGHAKVTDTYWYVTGIPELLSESAKQFEAFGESRGENQ